MGDGDGWWVIVRVIILLVIMVTVMVTVVAAQKEANFMLLPLISV